MALKVGSLYGVLELDANPFVKGLERAKQRGASGAREVGDEMTKKVTLPLLAAGTAALKMGVDFDTSMSRIVGLVGVSADEVDKLREGVLQLSGETAKGPQELADAMFTVTSAGFRGADAMDVLTAAAKASAAGLGETNTIAQALTGAVNAYGPEVLDAARATDILVATARAGNFESSQLAGSLGKITPFAKQAGASLEDVGGAIALLTRVNNNATESGTQVAAMMRAFVVPTAEATKILDDLGMSTQDVRDSMGEHGLVATLQMLDEKLGGNREALGRMLGSSEAASAAFQILEADGATLAGTFGTVADSAGMTDEAFAAASETAGFQLQQALAEVQAALITAGDEIAPFVATVASGIGDVAAAFSGLPGPVQTGILVFAGITAAMGPALSIGGRIVDNYKDMAKFAPRAWGAIKAGGPIILGIGAAFLAAKALTDKFNKGIESVNDVMDDLAGSSTDALVTAFEDIGTEVGKIAGESDGARAQLMWFEAAAEDNIGTAQRLRNALKEQGHDVSELDRVLGEAATAERQMAADTEAAAGAVDEFAGVVDGAGDAAAGAAGGVDEYGEATEEAVDPTEALADSIQAVTDAWRAQIDPFFAAQDAMDSHREAQEAVTEAEWQVLAAINERNTAIKEHGENSDEATEAAFNLTAAERDLEEKQRDVVRSAGDVSAATYELKRMMDESDLSIEGAKDMLNQWVKQGYLTEEQARQAANELGLVALAAGEADGKRVDIPVAIHGASEVMNSLYGLDAAMRRLPNSHVFTITQRTVQEDGSVSVSGNRYRHEGGHVTADMPYLVGTYGHEELFVPDSAGTIFSHGETEDMLGAGPARRGGSGGGGVAVVESTITLDGRKIGSSRSVIEGMDTAKAKRSRNTGGRG